MEVPVIPFELMSVVGRPVTYQHSRRAAVWTARCDDFSATGEDPQAAYAALLAAMDAAAVHEAN